MCKAKGFIIGATLLVLVLMPGNIGLACGAKPAQAPTSPPPITEPAPVPPAPAQLPEEAQSSPNEYGTPANYTTYTDEARLFSISYPSDWVRAMIPNTKMTAFKAGLPDITVNLIFSAGRVTATDYEPNVYIITGPLPPNISTFDSMLEWGSREISRMVPDYREFSRVKTNVDGREAAILDWEGTDNSSGPKEHFLDMYLIVNKTCWLITCSAHTDDFALWENDFNTIVRSIKILQTQPSLTPSEIADYNTTYTDESGLFSISYPSDWETTPPQITEIGKNAEEAINRLQSGLSVQEFSLIFIAGQPTATGYEPAMNIALDLVPTGISPLDQIVESYIQMKIGNYPDLQELSRIKTTVNGREAIILEMEATSYLKQCTLYFLQLFMLTDKAIWVVTCSSTSANPMKCQYDFNTIVRSLRISK